MSELRRRRVSGAILLVLGLGLLASQLAGGLGEAMVLLLIGSAFIAGYLHRRSYGLLIPGSILLGLGAGSVGEKWMSGVGDLDTIGLGAGFVAIYIIDTSYRGGSHWWPLIPGAILVVAGVASGSLEHLISVGWPLVLVVIGLRLLVGGSRVARREKLS